MIIVGSGMTACLAAMFNQHAKVWVREKEIPSHNHKAILRFPSPRIQEITGIECQRVTVTKSIVDAHDEHFHKVTIQDIANYSKKVNGTYEKRSIADLSTVERWVPPQDFHARMINILRNRIVFGIKDEDILEIEDGIPIISTENIGLNRKLFGTGPEMCCITEYNEIYVNKFVIKDCNLWHTIYYPFPESNGYRASIEGNVLTIESIEELEDVERHNILFNFGINSEDAYLTLDNHKQEVGKMLPMDNTIRKNIIHRLTLDDNVYSLGRQATWRSITLDDVAKDLVVINRLINQSEYDARVG